VTEASYQANRRKGVTGEKTPTCLPAAFDRISLSAKVSTSTYRECIALDRLFEKEGCGDDIEEASDHLQARHRKYEEKLLRELHASRQSWRWEFVTSKSAFESRTNKLLGSRRRVCVVLDLDGPHGVGLMEGSKKGLYIAKTTWTPWRNEEVSAADIWRHVSHVPPRNGADDEGNLLSLPPG